IFTTSAPQSASTAPADGPATHSPSSTTRIPVNGPAMTLLSRRGRLRAAQEELAVRARDARAGVMDFRLDDPVARVRPIDARRRQLARRLDRTGSLVAHGELAGHHAMLGDQGHDGARHLVEERRHDATVRQPRGAVKAVGDGAARDDALAQTPEAELEPVAV